MVPVSGFTRLGFTDIDVIEDAASTDSVEIG
jgi:hypothetical protein